MVVFAFLCSLASFGLWIWSAAGKCQPWVPGLVLSIAMCLLTMDAALHYLKS